MPVMHDIPTPANPVRSRLVRLSVIVVTILGALVRIWYQRGRSFAGDEVGTLIGLGATYRYLVTHYVNWLSMNYYIVGLKFVADTFGRNPWILTAPSLLGNVAAIPLTYLVGRRFAPERIAAMAAAIVAFNPYVIDFAPLIRAYSIHLALSLLTILFYERWRDSRSWRAGTACAITALFMCLNHMVGVYTVAAIAALETISLCADLKTGAWPALRARFSLIVPMLAIAVLLACSVSLYYAELKMVNAQFTTRPPGNVSYIVPMTALFFGGEWSGFAYGILIVLGCAGVVRAHLVRPAVAAFFLAPVILMAMQGVAHLSSAYARFDIGMVPFCALLVAAGISFLCDWMPWGSWISGTACALLLALFSTPALLAMQREKIATPWRKVHDYLAVTVRPGDMVVGSILDLLSVAGTFLDTPDPLTRAVPSINTHPSPLATLLGPGAFRLSQIALFRYDDFSQLPDAAFTSSTVFSIASDSKIHSQTPTHHQGSIQVLAYTGPKAQVLAHMAADLAATTRDKRDPVFISYYLFLGSLSKALNRPTDAEHYDRMALESLLALEHQWQGIPYRMLPDRG